MQFPLTPGIHKDVHGKAGSHRGHSLVHRPVRLPGDVPTAEAVTGWRNRRAKNIDRLTVDGDINGAAGDERGERDAADS
jgi:hypothetical protein